MLHANLRDAYSAIFRVATTLRLSIILWRGGHVGEDGPQDYPASASPASADLFARLRRAEIRRVIREHAERAERSKVAIFCAGVLAGAIAVMVGELLGAIIVTVVVLIGALLGLVVAP